ncbi:MAG: hypothetical protein JWQ66_2142 [Mucilaginibacter sp.]|nr:hypothetical protein [Mucilaginibacter sp.]
MEVISKIRKIQQRNRPSARCGSSIQQQAKKRPAVPDTHAFLNYRFLPFWAVAERNYKALEAEFFASFNNLSALYNMPAPFLDGLVFPQNVAEAYEHLCGQFKKLDEEIECIIMRDEQHKATLATIKNYNTGQCLYYIPVNPLWQIINCAEQQPLAELLLSVFAYLYQVAGIPFYRDIDSYLMYQYEYIDDWINEEEVDVEQDYKDRQNGELTLLAEVGDRILSIIRQSSELDLLESRIEAYRKWEGWDLETECFASAVLQLYREYPERTVFDNIHPELFGEDEDGRVRADQYISFFWSSRDTLYDMLYEMVNNELQEYGISEEPAVVQVFDCPQSKPLNDLNFEKSLFELLDRLCDILNPFDHDKHQ